MASEFIFTNKEIRRFSNLSKRKWMKEKWRVVKEHPPYNMNNREKALREAYAILSSMNIKFWLSGGCLLGAVRDNDFIPWDDDVDMVMFEEEFIPIKHQLKEKLLNSGFIVRMIDSAFFPKITYFKYGQKLALSPLYLDGHLRRRPYKKYLAKYFNGQETTVFKGMKFLKPSPVEEFLTHVYGDWKTPQKKKEENHEEIYEPEFFSNRIILRKIQYRIKLLERLFSQIFH